MAKTGAAKKKSVKKPKAKAKKPSLHEQLKAIEKQLDAALDAVDSAVVKLSGFTYDMLHEVEPTSKDEAYW